MFILLNGAFGVGKTTAARALAEQLPGSAIYDPERLGFILGRIPPWLLGRSRQPDDFQDVKAWRVTTVVGARLAHVFSPTVVVPMAFSNIDYWTRFRSALETSYPVRSFCLVAPLATVRERLTARAVDARRPVDEWAMRHAEICTVAHADAAFGEPVDASVPPDQVVQQLRSALGVGDNLARTTAPAAPTHPNSAAATSPPARR